MRHDDVEQDTQSSGVSDLFDRFRERLSGQSPLTDGNDDHEAPDAPADLQDASSTEKPAQDSGSLPPEARRALVSLLRQGVVLASQKSNLFESICRYQDAVRSHLADVYLKLVLDQRTGVAFVAGLDEEDNEEDEAVSLITRRTLTLYDTLLLLILRKHFQERETAGEQRIIIDIEKIEANLSPFLPLTNSTRSDRRKLASAVKKMSEKHILSAVRGSDDRFEITPIIRYVVNAGFLESMLEEYTRLALDAGLTSNAPDNSAINAGA